MPGMSFGRNPLAKWVYNRPYHEPYPIPSAGKHGATAKAGSGIGSISAPRWRMPSMFGLLVAWGILTGILIILLIYRSTLTMHEDDSIFLHDTESQMHKDQMEVLVKMKRITPIVKVLGALSGVMILVIAGLFIYDGLTRTGLQ
jgi:hypothetical protein